MAYGLDPVNFLEAIAHFRDAATENAKQNLPKEAELPRQLYI